VILSLRERVDALRRTHKESLLLSRARVVNQLKEARNERYREQRQRALEYLDTQLREFGAGVSKREDVPNGARLN